MGHWKQVRLVIRWLDLVYTPTRFKITLLFLMQHHTVVRLRPSLHMKLHTIYHILRVYTEFSLPASLFVWFQVLTANKLIAVNTLLIVSLGNRFREKNYSLQIQSPNSNTKFCITNLDGVYSASSLHLILEWWTGILFFFLIHHLFVIFFTLALLVVQIERWSIKEIVGFYSSGFILLFVVLFCVCVFFDVIFLHL